MSTGNVDPPASFDMAGLTATVTQVAAGGGGCQMKCPQCQALISLVASLAVATPTTEHPRPDPSTGITPKVSPQAAAAASATKLLEIPTSEFSPMRGGGVLPSSEEQHPVAPLAPQHIRLTSGRTVRVIPSHRRLNSLRSAFNAEVFRMEHSVGDLPEFQFSVSDVGTGALRPKGTTTKRKPSNFGDGVSAVNKPKTSLSSRDATVKPPVPPPESPLSTLVRFGSVPSNSFGPKPEVADRHIPSVTTSSIVASVQSSRATSIADGGGIVEVISVATPSIERVAPNPLISPPATGADVPEGPPDGEKDADGLAWLGLALNSPLSVGASSSTHFPRASMKSNNDEWRVRASEPRVPSNEEQSRTEGTADVGTGVDSNSANDLLLTVNDKLESMRRRRAVFVDMTLPTPCPNQKGEKEVEPTLIHVACTNAAGGDDGRDDGTPEGSASENSPMPEPERFPLSWLKRLIACVGTASALDDAGVPLQAMDVLYVVSSGFLCCLALFLLNAPSRPWLISDATGALVLIAQLFTIGWTILRYFVRNRDAKSSFVVNDTVGDTSKKYIRSAAFWLDLIVVIPVEWMVVPLLREQRDVSWWSTNTIESNRTLSTRVIGSPTKTEWETTAAVFSFLMLRHLLRYWRIASLISSSNPIVSERSIFRFLTAVAIALAVVCSCAVAFQTWEGPTLAPLLSASQTTQPSQQHPVNTYSDGATPLYLSATENFTDEGVVTTPALFASFDALYWSMTTALTVGYGDITPRTPGGRAIAIITMIVGTALFSTMTAIATSYFANKDPVQQELEERKRKMTSMLEYFEVPWELQRDVIASFPAVMEAHSRAAFLDMIEHLPEICRKRVEGYSRLRLLRQIALFEGIERDHAFLLAKCLTQQFVAAQDTVVMQGELGNEMYFIVHGMLDVVVEVPGSATKARDQIVVATLRDGAFFGERGLLHDTARGASVVAIILTELLVLTRVDFEQVVCRIPEVLEAFRRNVFKQSGGAPPPATLPVQNDECDSQSSQLALDRTLHPTRSVRASDSDGSVVCDAPQEDLPDHGVSVPCGAPGASTGPRT